MTSMVAVTVLGFFLGMRHAADPDHVIAVTTIVSRHASPRRAAVIGVLWGVGHTLTILVVGAGIVLLGWWVAAWRFLSPGRRPTPPARTASRR